MNDHTGMASDAARKIRNKNMLGFKRIVVAQNERALLLKKNTVFSVLRAGVYHFFSPLRGKQFELYSLNQVNFSHSQLDFIRQFHTKLFERFFVLLETNKQQVGLLYLDSVLSAVLAPGQRHVFWKCTRAQRVELLNINEEPLVPDDVARLMVRTLDANLLEQIRQCVLAVLIEPNHEGLLSINGAFKTSLSAGVYGFWRFNREITIEVVEKLPSRRVARNGEAAVAHSSRGTAIPVSDRLVWQRLKGLEQIEKLSGKLERFNICCDTHSKSTDVAKAQLPTQL